LNVVMIIGTVTALLGATIALVQPDIKRVVAYSTISQLGYMFAGLGVGAYGAAIFHLLMHGIFKALLFLGCGSVIHGMHGEQDMNRMGQLFRKMPVTAITFIIGALSNAGFWFFTGFWSKDSIIAMATKAQPLIGGLLIFGSLLTAFYMFRLVFIVFWGPDHVDPHIHPHESGGLMIWPLIILAVPAAILGLFIGLPPEHGLIDQFLHPTFQTAVAEEGGHVPTLTEFLTFQTSDWGLLIIGGMVATIGIFFAWLLYYRESDIPRAVSEFPGLRAIYQAMLNRWYFDDLYDLVFRRGGVWLTNLSWAFDRGVVDGLVNGVAGFLSRSGGRLRRTTTGFVGNYAFSIALGVLVLITYLFFAADVFGSLRRWLGF
jgi:NADH-quinone oxidoreductase subunit L